MSSLKNAIFKIISIDFIMDCHRISNTRLTVSHSLSRPVQRPTSTFFLQVAAVLVSLEHKWPFAGRQVNGVVMMTVMVHRFEDQPVSKMSKISFLCGFRIFISSQRPMRIFITYVPIDFHSTICLKGHFQLFK